MARVAVILLPKTICLANAVSAMKRKVNEKWQMKKKAKESESESERDNAAQALRINVRGQHSTATPIQAQLTDLAKQKPARQPASLRALPLAVTQSRGVFTFISLRLNLQLLFH